MLANIWKEMPAKTVVENGRTQLGISVWQHCLLTGEVLRTFLLSRHWNQRNRLLPDTLVALGGLHDVGKVNPLFLHHKLLVHVDEKERTYWQEVLPFDWRLAETLEEPRHEAVSVAVQRELKASRTLAREVIGAHHDKRWTPVKSGAAYLGGAVWQQARIALATAILDELHVGTDWPSPDCADEDESVIYKLWAGTLILSDWIASRRLVSYPEGEQGRLAEELMREAGFDPRGPVAETEFSQLFGYPPRRLQAKVKALYNGPGLYILEAPTGYGKTEAALALAAAALKRGDADGLYFALPTQMTSDRMIGRVRSFVSALYGEDKTVRLLHSGARARTVNMGKDAAPGGDWFRTNRQALLAPFAVGTIDQALLASLPVRFSALRLAGLAGKVVIFDEIHSYDTYTGHLIQKLFRDLRAIGAVVVVLSATLTDKLLAELTEEAEATWATHRSALRCTVKTDKVTVHEWPLSPDDNHPVWLRLSEDETALMTEVVERVRRGERVMWVENTVGTAQDVAKRFKTLGVPFGLLHSRYRSVDRMRRESLWADAYGKKGKAERGQGMGTVLVGTQVLEQSLDLDADFLVTRLAPLDMLVQRIGRLWRHADTPRPAGCDRAEAVVITTRSEQEDCPFPSQIYYPYVLERTYEVLRTLPSDQPQPFPEAVRGLLQSVYAEREEEANSHLARLKKAMEENVNHRREMAEGAQSIGDSGHGEALTRYSEFETFESLIVSKEELADMPETPAAIAVWAEERIVKSHAWFDGTTCSSWDGWPGAASVFFQKAGRFRNMPVFVLANSDLKDPRTGEVSGTYTDEFGLLQLTKK